MGVIFTLAGIFALALTIVVFVLVVPNAKRKGMTNPFLIFLHDLFNFNQLWLEKIFKFLYVLSTISCVAIGIPMIFWFEKRYYYSSFYRDYDNFTYEWRGYIGILLVILGPIVVRIAFEAIMMFILLVKNTMEINKKMDSKLESSTNTTEQKNEMFDSQSNSYQDQNQYQFQNQTQNQSQSQSQSQDQFNSESAPQYSNGNHALFCAMCGHSVGEDGRCSFCGKQN